MAPTDPCVPASEQVGTRSPGGTRVSGRRGLVPTNVFFVRWEGRVAALLVGRQGQVRMQADARERWRLMQISAAVPRPWPGRMTLRGTDGALTVRVYGQDEADHLDLGNVRPRQAGTAWRAATRRTRRQAARRLAGMLGR